MGVSQNDIRCTAIINGDFDRGTRYDVERALSWVIAFLEDDDAAITRAEQQIGDCPDCLRAVAGYAIGEFAGILLAHGGKEIALRVVRDELSRVLSSPDIINTDPPPEAS